MRQLLAAVLAWKKDQAEKLGRAMELLGRLKAAESAAPAKERPKMESPAADGRLTLLYFKKPSCPHCISQDGVLAAWLPNHPDIQIDIVLPGERPELWKQYGIRGTPTMVVRSPEGREEILVGLHSEAQLGTALKRSRAPAPELSPSEEKETSK